jgi:hypothetical protein
MVEQRRLKTTSVVVTPLVSLLPILTVEASVGGEESCTFHPWSTWDVLGAHVEVVTHVVGRVCCSSGVPLGGTEERVASSEVFTYQPMALSSSFSVSSKETWEPLMGPKLTEAKRRRLMQFLRAYTSYFAFNMKELGVLIGFGIWIVLASDMPIFCRPYKYSDMERDLIWSRTLDLLEAGLMELSHGEYASTIVMPAKKDVHGNYTDRRMCGDYYLINWHTKSDKYAMPTPEEIFDVVGHARVFSTLDLRAGYH